MKKKLEADLMSIAHRVLQMKNKSDINQLCVESRKLYEKLAILQFVEAHFGGAKPTIGQAEIVEKMKQFFEENSLSESPSIKVQEEVLEVIVDEVVESEVAADEIGAEKISDEEIVADEVLIEETIAEKTIVGEVIIEEDELEEEIVIEALEEKESKVNFMPAFELDEEEEKEVEEEKIQAKTEEVQISFMDLLGADYTEPMFVKVDHNLGKSNPLDFDLPKEADIQKEREVLLAKMEVHPKDIQPKAVSLNEKLAHGIKIDLNDRIGFVKNLFGNSEEDYTRVLNQLITYDNFDEARSFIEDMVKPDYNDWEGKEEYEQRFIEIIEKKFA